MNSDATRSVERLTRRPRAPAALPAHAIEIACACSQSALRKPVAAQAALPIRFGAVAQLGERVNGIHEVRGSIPLGSTNKIKHLYVSRKFLLVTALLMHSQRGLLGHH